MWKRGNKFRATKVSHAGMSFDSKLESAVFDLLKLLEKAKELSDIKTQRTIYLTEARISYRVDFEAIDTNTSLPVFIEAKGFETPEWRLKKRLWKFYGPGPLQIYGGTYRNPKLMETITPSNKSPAACFLE